MTLRQMSYIYREEELHLRQRVTQLRQAEKEAGDRGEVHRFRRRIAEMETLLRQTRELADLTAHYYERSFYRNDKYTL